jgi:hypothetical protein
MLDGALVAIGCEFAKRRETSFEFDLIGRNSGRFDDSRPHAAASGHQEA